MRRLHSLILVLITLVLLSEEVLCDPYFAASRNGFWRTSSSDAYEVRITGQGVIQFHRGHGTAWQNFDPQPSGTPTHIAAGNNRVIVRTSDGKLHWTCLVTDIASWVEYNFAVLQNFVSSSSRFAQLLSLVDTEFGIDTMLRELASVGDLPGSGSTLPADHVSLISDWLQRYVQWLQQTHLVPSGALHGPWNTIARGLENEPSVPDSSAVIDVAVGHWHLTVVTYYVLLSDGRIIYLDEEPIMPEWRVMPGTATTQERQSSGINVSTNNVLAASHSVLGILQPVDQSVVFIRFDYHNPDDFKLFPLLDWTESKWHKRPVPFQGSNRLWLDSYFHKKNGNWLPWPVPKPHPFIHALKRYHEDALRTHIRDYQRWPRFFDWILVFPIPLWGLLFRMIEISGQVNASPTEPSAGLGIGIPEILEILDTHVRPSKAIATALDDLRLLENELWNHMDSMNLFPGNPNYLSNSAASFAQNGDGLLIVAWRVILLASAELDRVHNRVSGVGAFGDNPIKPVSAYPINIWVQNSTGYSAQLYAAQARHTPSQFAPPAYGVTPSLVTPPEWISASWSFGQGPLAMLPSGYSRPVVIQANSTLPSAPSTAYVWTIKDSSGRVVTSATSNQPSYQQDFIISADSWVVGVEGIDQVGDRVKGSMTFEFPNPRALLTLDYSTSSVAGPPVVRSLPYASVQQGNPPTWQTVYALFDVITYLNARVIIEGENFYGPIDVSWSTGQHGHSGSKSQVSLPSDVIVGTTPNAMLGTSAVDFVLEVEVKDSAGQTGNASIYVQTRTASAIEGTAQWPTAQDDSQFDVDVPPDYITDNITGNMLPLIRQELYGRCYDDFLLHWNAQQDYREFFDVNDTGPDAEFEHSGYLVCARMYESFSVEILSDFDGEIHFFAEGTDQMTGVTIEDEAEPGFTIRDVLRWQSQTESAVMIREALLEEGG